MATQGLEPDLIEGLISSSREVMETMVFMTPEAIDATNGDEIEVHPNSFTSEVICTLGFTGTRSGAVVVTSSKALACRIAAKMLMMEPDEFESFSEAADGFGEVVNMITGNFKNAWVAKGNEMHLAVPTVSQNGEVHIHHKEGEINCRIRVVLEGEPLEVTVLFEGQD
ncbi:MAG: chemotaxis protein CheX [Planctomycetes bacterium]|nr:chemotaxis protein CheX [Planctomycetota bacterium]